MPSKPRKWETQCTGWKHKPYTQHIVAYCHIVANYFKIIATSFSRISNTTVTQLLNVSSFSLTRPLQRPKPTAFTTHPMSTPLGEPGKLHADHPVPSWHGPSRSKPGQAQIELNDESWSVWLWSLWCGGVVVATLGYFFPCFSSLSCCCCGWWHFGKGYSGIEARSGLGNTTLQPHGTVSNRTLGLPLSIYSPKQINCASRHRISVANVPAHLLGSAMHALKFVAEPGKRFPHHVVDNKVNNYKPSLERYCNHKRSARMLSAWHALPPFQPHQLLLFTTSSHPEGPERSARKHRPWTSNLQWY